MLADGGAVPEADTRVAGSKVGVTSQPRALTWGLASTVPCWAEEVAPLWARALAGRAIQDVSEVCVNKAGPPWASWGIELRLPKVHSLGPRLEGAPL